MAASRVLFRDYETRSAARLDRVGAWRYASDSTTDVLCVGYAVNDGPVEVWRPGSPIPEPVITAARDPDWLIVAHNDQFETAVETHVLHTRYDWPLIPLEQHRCTMARALAAALPGSLDKAAAALGLPFRKDPAGHRLMRQLSQFRCEPTPEQLGQLFNYCRRDLELARELFRRLQPLSDAEQAIWVLDQQINARGFYVDRGLAQAAHKLTREEQAAINNAIATLTNGRITTANQVGRILAFMEERGHRIKGLSKRSVSAVLAHGASNEVRQLLELRRAGAGAAVRKLDALFAGLDSDDRLRGTLRFHGASTGRWSGRGYQPQNLKKPEIKDLDAAITAILNGDHAQVRKLGPPLATVGDISRALICAAPGHVLMAGDFSAIESRVLAFIAGEQWKLDNYRRFDATGDPALEPYCVTASKILKRPVTPADEKGRETGKVGDLACGFGGSVGAWRRFAPDDDRSDPEIRNDVTAWRAAHPATVKFWRGLETAIRRALVTGQRIVFGRLAAEPSDGTLYLTLPSGRRLSYPQARLAPGKFGAPQVEFKDNAYGKWCDTRGWHGSFTENVVSAISRDLLAAALLRLEAAGYPIVLHVHDEVVAEVPEGFGSLADFHKIMTTLPGWATGLPIAAKVRIGPRYAKTEAKLAAPAELAAPLEPAPTAPPEPVEPASPKLYAGNGTIRPVNGVRLRPNSALLKSPAHVPLADLIGEPLTADGKICCPFHDDRTPSLHVYPDGHFHCFGCGAHGDAIDWPRQERSDTDLPEVPAAWNGPLLLPLQDKDDGALLERALQLWDEGELIVGTPTIRYLADVRGIDTDRLPVDVDLRFHPRCPFGPSERRPCLLALFRDVATNAPAGIHRIALTPAVFAGGKVERLTLGRWPKPRVVKLWPAEQQLVVGEGIETVLAAATRLRHRGAPMRPAWAAGSKAGIAKLPIIPGVDRLLILVDHDLNGSGQAAAQRCAERWSRAGRTVVRLTPKQPGTDFNDILNERMA